MNESGAYLEPVIVNFDIEGWKREYHYFEKPQVIHCMEDIEKYVSDEGEYPYILWFHVDTFESLEALGVYVEALGFVKRIAYAILVVLREPGNFSSGVSGHTEAYCVATKTKRDLFELKFKIPSNSIYREFIAE
jgi:hypothetical protein